jgi:hypothetical protein
MIRTSSYGLFAVFLRSFCGRPLMSRPCACPVLCMYRDSGSVVAGGSRLGRQRLEAAREYLALRDYWGVVPYLEVRAGCTTPRDLRSSSGCVMRMWACAGPGLGGRPAQDVAWRSRLRGCAMGSLARSRFRKARRPNRGRASDPHVWSCVLCAALLAFNQVLLTGELGSWLDAAAEAEADEDAAAPALL